MAGEDGTIVTHEQDGYLVSDHRSPWEDEEEDDGVARVSRFVVTVASWHAYVPGRGWVPVGEAAPTLADHGLARLELGLDDAGDLVEVSYVTAPCDAGTVTPGAAPGSPASSPPDGRDG